MSQQQFSTQHHLSDPQARAIFETAVDGIITIDAAGTIVAFNPAAERLFGYSAEEICGQGIHLLMPPPYEAEHNNYVQRYLQTGEKRIIGIGREVPGRRKDGTIFPLELAVSEFRVAGERFFTGIVRDISERKKLEQALRESEERLRFMVENLPTGAAYVDLKRQTIFFNRAAARITGYSPDEIDTLDEWFSRLYGDEAEQVRAVYEEDQRRNFPESRTVTLICKNGERRRVEFAAHRYDHHEVWLLHDVTELQKAQQRLVQSERLAAIGQMMTGLAHESRNALQRALACLDMLEIDLPPGRSDLLQLTQRARDAMDELHRLYEEVRSYAAPLRLERGLCCLTELCRSVWQKLEPQWRGKKIRFHLATSAEPVESTCRADSHRMEQVLRNIFENAIAAVGTAGTITVQCREVVWEQKPAVQLTVTDTGPGLSVEELARVFDPFFTTRPKGTGLGMAIAKRIVEAHGGRITIGNRREASGAEVTLLLPKGPHTLSPRGTEDDRTNTENRRRG